MVCFVSILCRSYSLIYFAIVGLAFCSFRISISFSISIQHLWHLFWFISKWPLVLFTIVGSVDDRACTHQTLFPVLNPLSDHSQSLICLDFIMVTIALLLLIHSNLFSLLFAYFVFLWLVLMLWSRSPFRCSPFTRSISTATAWATASSDLSIFSLAFFLAIVTVDYNSISPRPSLEWIQSVEVQGGRCRISFTFALIILSSFLA